MNSNRSATALLALAAFLFLAPYSPATAADPSPFRIWKNTEATEIEARLVERRFTIAGESVQFRNLKSWEALPNDQWEATRKKLERRMD